MHNGCNPIAAITQHLAPTSIPIPPTHPCWIDMHGNLYHLEGLWHTDNGVSEKWVLVNAGDSFYAAWRADAIAISNIMPS